MDSKKFITKLFTFVAAVAALVVSIRSCSVSEKALDYSERFFVLENRPWLRLKLHRYQNNSYYYIYNEDGKTTVEYKCHIENFGKHAAKDLSFFVDAFLGEKACPLDEDLPIIMELAPGDSEPLIITTRFQGERDEDSPEALVKRIIEEQGAIVDIVAGYSSNLEPSMEYKSRKKYQIYGKRYTLLSAESK